MCARLQPRLYCCRTCIFPQTDNSARVSVYSQLILVISILNSNIASGGGGWGRVPPWQQKHCQNWKKEKTSGKEGKIWEKEEKLERKGKNREGSFTMPLLTYREGWLRHWFSKGNKVLVEVKFGFVSVPHYYTLVLFFCRWKPQSSFTVPEHWDIYAESSNPHGNFQRCPVSKGSDEYHRVERRFKETMSHRIVSIERVQNMDLWEDYSKWV